MNLVISIILTGLSLLFMASASQAARPNVDEYVAGLRDRLQPELDTTVIENKVQAEANTGGNQAESGQVINGQAQVSGQVRTSINGEVIVDENISDTQVGGQANIEIKSRVTNNGEQEPRVEVEVIVNDKVIDSALIETSVSNSSDLVKEEKVLAPSALDRPSSDPLPGVAPQTILESLDMLLPETSSKSPDTNCLESQATCPLDQNVLADTETENNLEANLATNPDLSQETTDLYDWLREFLSLLTSKIKDIVSGLK